MWQDFLFVSITKKEILFLCLSKQKYERKENAMA